MRSKIAAGITAGLIAGLVFGIMMQYMTIPSPDGSRMPMMAMVAKVVHSKDLMVGWIYHLFNSAVIGGIFGWLLGTAIVGFGSGIGWGLLYGLLWWVLGGLILMPVLLDMQPFAPLNMPEMRQAALGSLFGHLIYGLILGIGYVMIRGPEPVVIAETMESRKAGAPVSSQPEKEKEQVPPRIPERRQ